MIHQMKGRGSGTRRYAQTGKEIGTHLLTIQSWQLLTLAPQVLFLKMVLLTAALVQLQPRPRHHPQIHQLIMIHLPLVLLLLESSMDLARAVYLKLLSSTLLQTFQICHCTGLALPTMAGELMTLNIHFRLNPLRLGHSLRFPKRRLNSRHTLVSSQISSVEKLSLMGMMPSNFSSTGK